MDVESRVLVIGIGSIALKHIKIIQEQSPKTKIVALRSGRGSDFEELNTCELVTHSLEDALKKKPSAIIISNPSPFHIKSAKAILSQGVPILIEKPLSDNLQDAEDFLSLAEKLNQKVLMGYVLRHNNGLRKLKNLIDENRLGKLLDVEVCARSYLPSWRAGKDYRQNVSSKKELGGGALLELSHEIDYCNWVFGGFNSVQASLKNSGTLDVDVEDSVDAIVELKDKNCNLKLHLDFRSKNEERYCKVFCEKGMIHWDYIEEEIKIFDFDKGLTTEDFAGEKANMYKSQMKHFFDVAFESRVSQNQLSEGVEVMRSIEAIRVSSGKGEKVYL